MSNNKNRYYKRFEEVNAQPEPEVVAEVETTLEHIDEPEQPPFGVVSDCTKLNMRKAPMTSAGVVCVVDCGTELMVDLAASNNEWYKVYCANGNEGYCMKKFITLK